MKFIYTLALVLLSGLCLAAGVLQQTSTLSWTAPAANTDGTAIVGALTYNVYATYGSAAQTKIVTGTSAITYTDSSPLLTDGSTACYSVTAIEGGVESAQATPVCKTFPAAIPSAPTNLVVK